MRRLWAKRAKDLTLTWRSYWNLHVTRMAFVWQLYSRYTVSRYIGLTPFSFLSFFACQLVIVPLKLEQQMTGMNWSWLRFDREQGLLLGLMTEDQVGNHEGHLGCCSPTFDFRLCKPWSQPRFERLRRNVGSFQWHHLSRVGSLMKQFVVSVHVQWLSFLARSCLMEFRFAHRRWEKFWRISSTVVCKLSIANSIPV